MRVVIIGGLGMIGQAVSELAVIRGHKVVVLSRSQFLQDKGANSFEVQQWDGKDAGRLVEVIDRADAVVNLAGESIGKSRWTENRKKKILQSRLEPALALMEAIGNSKHPPKTLLQASAVGVYGTGTAVIDESSKTGNDFLANLAIRWEESTQKAEGMGLRRVVIRSGIVLQQGAGVLPPLMLPFRLLVGGPTGSGKQVYSWIHIKDEAEAILFLLENSACVGEYNLTAPNPCSNEQFGRALARIMKKPYWLPLPGFALKLALGEMSTLVLDGQYVLPRRLLEAGYKYHFSELEPALMDLILNKKTG